MRAYKSSTILLSSILVSLLLFVNISIADGSLTVSASVLDSKIRPGGETTVFLTLTNPSSTIAASSIEMYILPGPYTSSPNSYIQMGSLDVKASQQTSVVVKISPTATSMTSYIIVNVNYYSGTNKQETTINVPITIDRVPILQATDVQYVPSVIEPGNKIVLHFNLENDGDGPAKDVRIVINQTPQKFVVDGSPEIFVDDIEPKDVASISFNVIVDPSVTTGTYSIPISLAYADETRTENFTAIKNIGLVVTGKYNFIAVLESQDLIAPGRSGSVTVKIANAGTQDAQFLTVTPLESAQFSQITPSVAYVGKISSDDYDTEKFTIKANSSMAPGDYPLQLQLEYKDFYGKYNKETYNATVKVSSQAELSTSRLPIVLIILLIAVIGVVAFFIFKRMKKK